MPGRLYTPVSNTAAFIPNPGFAISAPQGYGDTQLITITGPAGSFGSKPGGAKINYLARYGYGYSPNDGIQDPLSRNTWTDSFWPAATNGATGPNAGLPGLQQTSKAPGSGYGYQTIFPNCCVITGNLTNGSALITNVAQVAGTNFKNVVYSFGGIIVADIATNYISGGGISTTTSQTGLNSNQIQMSSAYIGTSHTGVTFQIAYGPDQISCPRPLIANPTQDQLFAFRGMNNFPWRTNNFLRQNNKFIRGFSRTPGLGVDFEVVTDGNGVHQLIGIYNEGTTTTQPNAYYNFNGNVQYAWSQNQWFQHQMWYHGNSTSGSTDGGLLYIVDGTVLFGTVGSTPNLGVQFWGAANGGGTNPTCWDYNDIACRPQSPDIGDIVITDYTAMDDSACAALIGNELQWPTAWNDTSITFAMHRSYLDATIGAGSLANLSLVIQKSNYVRTNCGSFTSAA